MTIGRSSARAARVFCALLAICHADMAAAQQSSGTFDVPAWLFPAAPPRTVPVSVDSVTLRHLPSSRNAFTDAQALDRFAIADWYPERHSAMPAIVSKGRKPVIACGFCHLPDGSGRPENAMLAGLPAAYIIQQVADVRSRTRESAYRGTFAPNTLMRMEADSATDAEIAAAARYFARQRPRQRSRVVEANEIPRVEPATGIHFPVRDGGVEPLAGRLIEMPVDPERHELHDAAAEYVAYVPPGSIARGRALATKGKPDKTKACTTCHGPQLRGVGVVPPIAGRAPSYILRQLVAFRTGTRAAPASAPMRDVAAVLTLEDMIAASAFVGSRKATP